MPNQLEHVKEYFPTGTAEGDSDILDRVFVYAQEFSQVIAPPKGSPHLLVGPKGSGKTAVLRFSLRLLSAQDVPSVLLTPFDIDSSTMGAGNSTGDLARSFYQSLLDAIVTKLSSESSGVFNNDYSQLYEYAISKGLRPLDFVTKTQRFLGELAKPFIGVNFNMAFPHLTATTKGEVEEAVKRVVGRKNFYLFIDDTDQVSNPGTPGHLNRVWALILASRRLSSDVSNLRVVVSLRTEVWQRMQRDDFGQRDQTDHFRQLVVNMYSDSEHVGRIVDRRLALAAAACNARGDGYQQFFDGASARPPMSNDTRLWRDLIIVRTRQRPRDAIQLINELARASIRNGVEKITEGIFQSVVPPFSKSIAEQFAEEVRPEFPQALGYLTSLAEATYSEGSFTMSAEGMKSHFSRMLPRYGGELYGATLSQVNRESPLLIWRFFFLAGVINARVSDTTRAHGFRHLDPLSEPQLVTSARWNELQSMLWEVNPIYRDFLISRQSELTMRTGLPRKPTRPRRRR